LSTTIQILPPAELREIDFSTLQAIAAIPEDERYAHAASMDLPTLGRFIQPAVNCAEALVAAYRPYLINFRERTAHQGEQKLLTDGSGKSVTRDELCRQTIGVGIRRLNQLLKVTDPDAPKEEDSPKPEPTEKRGQGLVTPTAKRRPTKFPKKTIDRLFRRFWDRRITADYWRAEVDKLEARYVGDSFMFKGVRERMETTIEYAARQAAKVAPEPTVMPDADAASAMFVDPEKEEDYDDEKRAKPHYLVTLKIEGSRLETMSKKAKEAFGDSLKSVEKCLGISSRADSLDDAQKMFEEVKKIVGGLKDEMEEWRDSIPESLQSGEKASEVEDCVGQLEELEGNLNDISFDNVEFPSMF
jgi:hypothetical protein